jgi:dipeptidase E
VATIEPADRNSIGLKDLTGLDVVDFHIEPHCEGERFKTMEDWAKQKGEKVYALDDQSAVRVVDGKVDVVSEGQWNLFK